MYDYNRENLVKDINFISKLSIPVKKKNSMKNELIEIWKYNSTDSPWNNEEYRRKKEKEAVETLISISKSGKSSEWCGEHIVFNTVETNNYNLRSKKKL